MDGLNLGNVPLGDHDADWLKVMAAVSNSSLRVKVASICGYFVRRRKAEYEQIISYTASKYGLTWDECFHRLRTGQDLGEPLDTFQVDLSMEEMINGEGE